MEGTVWDDSTGQPIENVQVLIQRTACGTLADSTGHFRIECSELPGDTLIVGFIGYQAIRWPVRIMPGRHYIVDISLKRVPARVMNGVF